MDGGTPSLPKSGAGGSSGSTANPNGDAVPLNNPVDGVGTPTTHEKKKTA